MGNSGMMGNWGMNGWGMGFGPFFMLFFAAIVLTLLFMFFRALFRSSSNNKPASALEILEERFARGEIDQNEFDSRRQILENQS